MKRRYIYLFFPILLIVSCVTLAWIWHKPIHKVEDEKGLSLSIDKLCQDFTNDETMADSLYLNKAIQIKGQVTDVSNNLEGATIMVFASSNNIDDLECTLREKSTTLKVGTTIIIKGFCNGKTASGVSLTDCIIVP